MKNRKLIDAFQYLDDELLALPKKKKPKKRRLLRVLPFAACFALILGSAFFALRNMHKDTPPERPYNEIVEGTFPTAQKTSDTYDTLEDLLSHLSRHDSHDNAASEDGRKGNSASVSGITEGTEAVTFGDYVYRLNTEEQWFVEILRIDGEELLPAGELSIPATRLFLINGQLFAIAEEYLGDELDFETITNLYIYDLKDAKAPSLTKKITQSGSLTTCYLDGDTFYLLTSDGVCACGWSRLEDTSDYVPTLSVGDTPVPWTEEEISILGEPSAVQYTAVTGIHTESLKIQDKHAYYGDLYKAFYGDGWLAFTTSTGGSVYYTMPSVYTFSTEETLSFTGKLSTSELLSLPERVKTKKGRLPNGIYASVVSVSKVGTEYRIIGNVWTNGKDESQELLAISTVMETGGTLFQQFPLNDYPYLSFDEILWEEDRVILSVSTMHNIETADLYMDNHFLFVEFSDTEIALWENDLVFDHVAGVDMMYTYGSPLGELESLIPMGGGIYLRYNEKPDGFDVYDFSDSSSPRLLYDSPGILPEGVRFDFQNAVYADGTFGVLTVTPSPEGEYFQNTTLTWHIYAVDPANTEEPLTLLREIPMHSAAYYRLP